MAVMDADRNLLFGVLALQMDFISREALVAAVTEWTRDRSRPLDQILVGQGGLTEARGRCWNPWSASISRHTVTTRSGAWPPSAAMPAGSDLASSAPPRSWPRSAGHGTESGATLTRDVGSPTSQGLRFRILRPHARGGIGLVSVAIDAELNREVALKEIRTEQADDPASRTRFVLEAEVTGRLEHPGVVPVYGLGSSPTGRPFYAMRLIKGDSLKEAIERFHREGEQPLGAAGSAEPVRGRLQRGRLCPQPGHPPPRPQAGQHHARPVRRDAGRRLGPGQGDRPRRGRAVGTPEATLARSAPAAGRARRRRFDGRHARLHEPGTGRGPPRCASDRAATSTASARRCTAS